ncbi:hypothetical protein GCM10018966_025670 [Streptomyces yanii]
MADTATRTRWSARTRRPVEPAQYRAIRYTERLDEAAAVGSKGDSYDNALAEAFNSLFKAELIRNKGPWTGINDVEIAVAEYIDWFNRRRLHGELGHVPPAEFLTRGDQDWHAVRQGSRPASRRRQRLPGSGNA